ncbi:MAG: hypothetical protein PW788_10295 [Micavibrio sp.]|nr:hypothetical protein [Micavibrio sp.]
MILTFNFNNSYKSHSPSHDMAHGLYVSSAYGSNAYCFDQAARLTTPTNDTTGAEATADMARKFLPQLA